jgi:transposase
MSQSFDLSRFPDLPPEVVKAVSALRFELSVERAARRHQQAVVAEKDAFITELKALIEKLEGQVQDYRRTKFGPKSEKLDPAQLELALEDLETAMAETQARIAAVEEKIAASTTDSEKAAPRKKRKARALPETLPRVEQLIEPDSIVCPCGCGDMVRIGEDRTERLDFIPARYQVIVSIRPKYACPKGRTGVVQAKAPAHLLEGSWPTEALLAQIAVSKHSEHMPLNRQAVVMARLGVPIDRSVLADWMGRTGALIAPVVDHMALALKRGSTRLYVPSRQIAAQSPAGRRMRRPPRCWTPGAARRRPAISGRCCAMTGAGTAPRRRASSSTIGPGVKGSMPPKYCTASTARSRSTPMAPIPTLPRQNARAGIPCGWLSAGRMGDAN